ncbi:MAG: EAL domain-containing protein [Candidatus Dormibacteraeota bacterium]|nr:EAL domain-containing protein [Candidatus Dormibacteraeota bacterium]
MRWARLSAHRPLLTALVAWAAVVLVLGAWLTLSWGGIRRTEQVDDFAEFLAAFLAAGACALAARHFHGRRRAAWSLIGVSAFSWGAGQVVWSYYELVKGRQAPFPSFADLGYLGAVPLAIAGVLCFASPGWRATSLIRTILDALVIAGSLLIVSWATVLGTLYRMGADSPVAQAISLAYPAGDIVIGTVIIILATRAARSTRLPLLLLGAGLLANLLADTSFAYLTTTNAYGPGNPIDVGWIGGYLLIAIAAWRAISTATAAAATRVDSRPPERVWMILPYVPVVAGAAVATWYRLSSGRLDEVIFWSFMFVVAVVVVRQFLMLADNQRLTRQLESNSVALREREDHFRSLVQNSSDVITLIDRDGQIQYQSASIERIFGYGGGQLIGSSFGDLVDVEDRVQVLRRIEEAIHIEGPPISIECRLQREDGSFCPSEVTITNLLHVPTVRGLVLNTRDISDRKALEEKLTHQAFHDSLTNLPNRAAFRVVLDHAMQGGDERRIAVLFLDLDDFKTVNDTLGHEAGDLLLAAVAKRIEATLRPGDTVARLGGDEFAVLLKNMEDETIAGRVADRITRQLSTPFAIEGRELFIHASIGIAGLVSGQEAAEDLLKNADVAMYIAKARGKSRYVEYEASLHRAAVDRMQLESDLQEALARQEFVLHYQPVVVLESGSIHSVEALVRWNHPRRGLLYPADFIKLAEQTGLIVELGRWVLQQATRDVRRWQVRYPSNPPMMVSVNVSGHQLHGRGLIADVASAVDAAGLDPQSLILELTESVLMEETVGIAQTLQELRARGVRLALDDFGTGYSSLGHLRDFAVDILKLDKSFVSGLGTGIADGAILRAVIGLGNSLELLTIGEGIERPEQLAALNAMGCLAGQGYHLSRPLPFEELDALLAGCIQSGSGRQLPPAWKLTA